MSLRAPIETFQVVNQSDGPPPRAWTKVYAYDGSSNLEYEGFAQSQNKLTEWTVDSGAVTQAVVSSDVATIDFAAAHGLEVGMRIELEGWTVDLQLNGSYVVATVTDSDTITIATSGVADATYTDGGARIYTYAPRKNDSVWCIRKYGYTANALVTVRWAEGKSSTQNLVWDDRASYAYL